MTEKLAKKASELLKEKSELLDDLSKLISDSECSFILGYNYKKMYGVGCLYVNKYFEANNKIKNIAIDEIKNQIERIDIELNELK